jgi:hypothetical protein
MSTDLQKPEAGEHFYQTRQVRVVWIPPRPVPQSSRRRVILGAKVVGGLAVVGLSAWGVERSRTPDIAAQSTGEIATVTPPVSPADPAIVAPAGPAANRTNGPTPAKTISLQRVPNDPDRRATLRNEIARCKNPSASCDVDQVLRMGAELVDLRKRANGRRPPARGQ